jgi:hypothetical protein
VHVAGQKLAICIRLIREPQLFGAAVRIGGATGIQQKVAFSLPLLSEIIRVWLTLLNREHESRENHGTQKPSCLTVTGLSCGF